MRRPPFNPNALTCAQRFRRTGVYLQIQRAQVGQVAQVDHLQDLG